jgi:MerR family transcriptional regulator, light-induced transcriptional regulator
VAHDDQAVLRIGEVARRTGVSVSTLRAWERRYELLEPHRTEGGHRLYREDDVARVRAMQQLVDRGWSASAAAREVRQGAAVAPPVVVIEDGSPAEVLTARLEAALDGFDAAGVDAVLDDAFARLTLPAALDEVVMPAMRWVGDGWEDDPRVIAREHVATNAVRPRLLRLLRTSVPTAGRVCVAATPEDEEHDVGVLAASAVAASVGWHVHFLGSRTPRAALERAVAELGASVVLVAALTEERARGFLDDRPDVGDAVLILGGAGFAALDPRPADAVVHAGGYRPLPAVLERAVARSRAS